MVDKEILTLCKTLGPMSPVPPQYTSRTCPECGDQDKLNRNGGVFKCLQCGYTEDDADIVGARNTLMRFAEELIVPLPARPVLTVE